MFIKHRNAHSTNPLSIYSKNFYKEQTFHLPILICIYIGEPFKVSCVKKETEAEVFFNPKKAQELRVSSACNL